MSDSLKVFDKVLADAIKIKEQGNFIPDCSTDEGYEASKQFVLKTTTPARTALDNAHKDAKAYWLEGGRNVDTKKNELKELLLKAEAPHKEAYKAIDEEKKRIKAEKAAALQNGIDKLNSYQAEALNASSSEIQALIDDCSCFDIDSGLFGKETEFVAGLQVKAIDQLTEAYSSKLRDEDMQKKYAEMEARQAKLDAEAAEQQRQIDEANQREQMRLEAEQAAAAETERLKAEAEAAELRRIQQEKDSQLAAEQAEQRRIEQEKQAAINAENARLKAIEDANIAAENARLQEQERSEREQARLKAEAESREADKKHRALINNQALDCFVAGGLDKESAKLAVKLIAARKVANTQINY